MLTKDCSNKNISIREKILQKGPQDKLEWTHKVTKKSSSIQQVKNRTEFITDSDRKETTAVWTQWTYIIMLNDR